ncbi:hypothetical protein IAE35_10685 [Pseudomonas sp. S75]|uniref:hypothetical protein n=1 Tax=unclassified Pseudomonas TaxID=196821 RepID=UPI0019044AFE|nr:MULTISPECIES: hypothetical protein [unclassified Pseudomonas]MBJ9976921.1 hypothetical protein [Pseudomonas sp. S30]MBK0153804.1 hypothetical protein [Pseudomonas sp. S75]
MKHKIWETSSSLLIAYEVLALGYKKALTIRTPLNLDPSAELNKTAPPKHDYANYNQSLALITLNASILEGTLRSIISEKLSTDINLMVDEANRSGRSGPTKPEELLCKFRDEVELQGGWENLKNQYLFYFNISMDKITDESTKEGINALFVLRNFIAHGTAIIQPSEKMEEEDKDIYPYTWQRKMQRAHVYLKSKFGHEGFFENLAEHAVPEHFMTVTKKFLQDISAQACPAPGRAEKTLNMIKNYSFGYINYSR